MSASSTACCCPGEPPEGGCRERQPCKVISTTLCVVGDSSGCDPAPVIEIVLGPNSTAVASLNARAVSQDMRLYCVTGESCSPTDPGEFPDDPGHDPEGDPNCSWNHPYVPSSTEWVRGRKICKTIASFTDAAFTWELDPVTCEWMFVARNVPVQIGKADTIEETGTADVGGEIALAMESDLTEEILCDIYLGPASTLVWCPEDAEGYNPYYFRIQKSDGTPFDRPFSPDWFASYCPDDVTAGDGGPFPPSPSADCGDETTFVWPTLAESQILYSEDLLYIYITVNLPPAGRVGYHSEGEWAYVPEQSHGDLTGLEPLLGYAGASQAWQNISGSVSVVPSNVGCTRTGPCSECIASNHVLACVGATLRSDQIVSTETSDYYGEPFVCDGGCNLPLIEGTSSVERTVITRVLLLGCSGGSYYLIERTTTDTYLDGVLTDSDTSDATWTGWAEVTVDTGGGWETSCDGQYVFPTTEETAWPDGWPVSDSTDCTGTDVESCADVSDACDNFEDPGWDGFEKMCTVTAVSFADLNVEPFSCVMDGCHLPSGLSWSGEASVTVCGPGTLAICVCPCPGGSICGYCLIYSALTTYDFTISIT